MNILITGGTGFLGRHLTAQFMENSHHVSILGRSASPIEGVKSFSWNPTAHTLDEEAFKDAECVIHLAGASLSEGRWTKKRKKEIVDSRVKSGELLYERLAKNRHNIKTFISASAVGIYGNSGDTRVDESSAAGNDFIAEVCKEWERTAKMIASPEIRVAILRIGIVLADDGGALPVLAKPVKLFAGAPLGSGRQYLSWIHVEDLCRIFMKAAIDDTMKGIYNAVAPNPVTNAEFTKVLARVLRRPLLLPKVPGSFLKLLLGEKATIVLHGQRVLSPRLNPAVFQFHELSEALKNIYGI